MYHIFTTVQELTEEQRALRARYAQEPKHVQQLPVSLVYSVNHLVSWLCKT